MKHHTTNKKHSSLLFPYIRLSLAAKQYCKVRIIVNGHIYILSVGVTVTFESFAVFEVFMGR